MPTKRRKVGLARLKDAAAMPAGAAWWLAHGQTLSIAAAHEHGLTDADAWACSCLHFDRPTASGWSRKTLRELGVASTIDAFIESGAVPPDRRRFAVVA